MVRIAATRRLMNGRASRAPRVRSGAQGRSLRASVALRRGAVATIEVDGAEREVPLAEIDKAVVQVEMNRSFEDEEEN